MESKAMRNIYKIAICVLVLALACACAKDNGLVLDNVKADGFGIVANLKSAGTKASGEKVVYRSDDGLMTVTTSDISALPATKAAAPGLCNSKSDFERLYARQGIGVYRINSDVFDTGLPEDNFKFTLNAQGLWKYPERFDPLDFDKAPMGFYVVAPYSDYNNEGRYCPVSPLDFPDKEFVPGFFYNCTDGKDDLLVGYSMYDDPSSADYSVPVTVDFQHVLSALHFRFVGVPSDVNIVGVGVQGWFNRGEYSPGFDLWSNLSVEDEEKIYGLEAGEDFNDLSDIYDSYLFLIPNRTFEGNHYKDIPQNAKIGVAYTVEGDSEPNVLFFPMEFDLREDAITNVTIMLGGDYVEFTAQQEQRVKFTAVHPEVSEYSYDLQTWTRLSEDPSDTVNVGFLTFGTSGHPNIYFRARNVGNAGPVGRFHFENQEVPVHVDGNIMALVDYLHPGLLDMSGCNFMEMFCGQKCLKNAPVLPATTLSEGAYGRMFESSGIAVAPELPARNLQQSCYAFMFIFCKDLVKAPSILPATVVPAGAYGFMFTFCEKLLKAPYLSAEDVSGDLAMALMFAYCTSLTEVQPSLNVTKLSNGNFIMLGLYAFCRSLKRGPELPAREVPSTAYASLFNGCVALEEAPYLPALYPGDGAYAAMFANCRKLKHIKIAALRYPYRPKPGSFQSHAVYTNNWIGYNYFDPFGDQTETVAEGTPAISPTGIIEFNKNIDWDCFESMRGTDWGYPEGWTVRYFDPDEE